MFDKKLIEKVIARGEYDPQALVDAFDMVRSYERLDSVEVDGHLVFDPDKRREAHIMAKDIRARANRMLQDTGLSKMADVYKHCLLFDAREDFDAYCRYLEFNRPREKKFYEPRRPQLLPVAHALQRLEGGELDLLTISLPPGVGKTTTAIFYLTWLAGKNPNEPMLAASHSNQFIRGVYDEILRITDANGEYLWHDVFPEVPLSGTNAKDCRIDFGNRKRFETIQLTSLNSQNAGLFRAVQLLYCDDLVPDIETAMSRDRMDKIWAQYYTDLRQRKQGGHERIFQPGDAEAFVSHECPELHIATRWSVHDCLGRLEEMYGNDPRSAFITFPALDENDESNFNFPYGIGFTTEFYHAQREIMDEASFKALYMNEPIEREGLLYPSQELRRYFELPEEDPDAIVAVCDTKGKGSDYCFMPIAYQYGNDYYIVDCVCNNYAPGVVEPMLVKKLLEHDAHMARFESNQAGGEIAAKTQRAISEKGGRTKITTKWTSANKETRILMAEPAVKAHFLFLDDTMIRDAAHREYRTMLHQLCSYSLEGKNPHDDVPDGMAQLVEFINGFHRAKATAMKRPF